MRFELVLMAAWLTVVVAAAPPARHLPVWSAVLDINSFTVWATMSNDNAIFAVVNNTVTSYNPGTGKLIWTSAISSVDILIVPAVNNKWLVVLTGTDIFVLAADNGSIVSHTQNFTSATSLVSTQDEDMFIAIDDSVGCHVVQVTRHGLQRVWASNQSLVSVGIVPGTPYMYLYTDTSFLYVVRFHTWSEFVLSGVVAVSPTPVGKRLAAVVGANVTMIELSGRVAHVAWSSALNNTLEGALDVFLAQTSISVFAVATVGTSTSPLLVLDAATGSVMANHSNEANVWGLSPTVAVTDGDKLLLIGRDTAVAGPTEYLFALNPRNGDASSGSFVPTLSTAQLQPVGGLCVVVPHGQGFTTFAASNTTLPVSYNLDSPGVQAVSTFSSAVSPSVFVLFNANGGLAGFTCLA